MAFADTASRKLLHGAGGAIVQVVAADGDDVGMSFGLGGLWQLIVGLLGSAAHLLVLPFEMLWHLLQAAVTGAAHLILLPFEALWHLLQATAAGISLCFQGLGHLIHGFFANLLSAVGNAGHLLVAPFVALWNLLQATGANAAAGIEGLGHLIQGFFANLVAAVGNAAHVLVLPFEELCRWLQIAVASVQSFFPSLLAALSSAAQKLVLPYEALCRWLQVAAASVEGFFPSLVAALSSAAHKLVIPFEAFGRWIQTVVADAAAGISVGLDGFLLLIRRSFASVLAALSSEAHKLVLPFEAFGRWIQTVVADAAAGISVGLDGFWPLIRRSFASVLATLANAADELVPALEAFVRWVKTTAAAALPYVLCVAVVVLLVAAVWFCPTLLATAAQLTGKVLMPVGSCVHGAGVGIAKALVQLVCWTAQYLHVIAMTVGRALSHLLPVCKYCFQCCASATATATMKAPGAAGFLISRAAFNAASNLTLMTNPTFERAVSYLRLEERRLLKLRACVSHTALAAGLGYGAAAPPAPTPPVARPPAPFTARPPAPQAAPPPPPQQQQGRRRRGRGGGGRNAGGYAGGGPPPANQLPPWSGGYNPWTGVVHAYTMPVPRPPVPGILGARPQAHQALYAAPQQSYASPYGGMPSYAPSQQAGWDPALVAALQQVAPAGSSGGVPYLMDSGASFHMAAYPGCPYPYGAPPM